MSSYWISKAGQSDLHVTAAMLAEYERLGWVLKSGEMHTNGNQMEVEHNPTVAGTLEALLVRHYQIAPLDASATAVHAAITLTAAAQVILPPDFTQPDFPRTLTVKGNAAGIAGNVVLQGLNIQGELIEETIALNAATEVEGTLAFASLLSATLPAKTNVSGDTVSIGMGNNLGMPHAMAYVGQMLLKLFNGSADAGTLAVDVAVEKNLYAPAGTPDGVTLLDLYYMA